MDIKEFLTGLHTHLERRAKPTQRSEVPVAPEAEHQTHKHVVEFLQEEAARHPEFTDLAKRLAESLRSI